MKNTVTAYVGVQPVLLYVPEVFTCKARPFSACNLKNDQPFNITVQNLFKICSKCKEPFMNQI